MLLKYQFYILCLILFSTSCKDDPGMSPRIEYKGQGEVISLPLPEFALPNTFCLKAAHFDGKDFLYFYNAPTYQIYYTIWIVRN